MLYTNKDYYYILFVLFGYLFLKLILTILQTSELSTLYDTKKIYNYYTKMPNKKKKYSARFPPVWFIIIHVALYSLSIYI